jgi:hypothetical protein
MIMKTAKYVLEIYEPGSIYNPWVSYESLFPFMALNRGDFINPGPWTDTTHPKDVARITGLEHLVMEAGDKIIHKVLVFTELVPNTPEGKYGQP